MNRPRTRTPKRPVSTTGAVAKDRKQAAIHLVRLEFEASRLEMAVAQSEERAEARRQELLLLQERRRVLIDRLMTGDR